jgi:hypothetical protein
MKKKIAIILLLAIKIPALLAAGYLIYQFFQIKPCLYDFTPDKLDYCAARLPLIKTILTQSNRFIKDKNLTAITKLATTAESILPYKDYLLGINQDHPTTYLILLQNDNELRTNGGFFGSYAIATANNGQLSFRFQDIGVPDGQLDGHVEPPAPVQKAFGNGWFKLRDSDWEADFTKTATTIRWFLEKGKEIDPDILMTLSLSDIKKVVDITGSFDVFEYNITITPDSLYSLLQNEAEINFFPGSTSKKDALTATGKALIKKLETIDSNQKLNLAYLLYASLKNQNILLNSKKPAFQQYLLDQNFAGQLTPPTTTKETLSDTISIIEANMGANKANCCVERLTNHLISLSKSSIHHQISINYINSSPLENPDPPRFYGGNYINYLRFYLPPTAQNIAVTANPTLPTTLINYPKPFPIDPNLDITPKYGFTEVGFFHITQANSKSSLTISYTLPLSSETTYELNILKQHGLQSSPQIINIFDKTFDTNLESDFHSQTTLK